MKRGRPPKNWNANAVKLAPITDAERDRLVAEFFKRGGTVTRDRESSGGVTPVLLDPEWDDV